MLKTFFFYTSKLLQAVALVALFLTFVKEFPDTMSQNFLWGNVLLFFLGYLLERVIK